MIDRAANQLGKTTSEFILDAACHKADEVLMEAGMFRLEEQAYQSFIMDLDAPVTNNKALRQLLKRKYLWDDEQH